MLSGFDFYLERLDQWALSVLMALYHLLGVQDLPKELDPHWQVVERWAPQPDGHYRLVLESQTIQDECRSGRAKYIIFPQTYMAKQEVYADSIRVYTNEMDKEWHLKSFLDRPVLSCDFFKEAGKVSILTFGYIKYFSTINEWPKTTTDYPREQIFYNLVYMIVGILSAFISTIFFVINFFFKEKNYAILWMGVTIYFLMFSHYSAYAIVGHITIMHQIAMITIACLGYIILCERNLEVILSKRNAIFIFILISEFFISYNRSNIIHLFVVINAAISVFLMLLFFLISNEKSDQRIIYITVFILGSRDFYKSQVLREGFLNLTLLCLVLILFMTYRILMKIYNKNLYYYLQAERVNNEIKILEKTKQVNEKIKQVLHDIKSPITSLNFIAKGNKTIDSNSIKEPIDRLNYLVSVSIQLDGDISTDWYSPEVLARCIQDVIKEKSYSEGKILFVCAELKNKRILFNPDYIKVIIAELIDNTLKNNIESVSIKIELIIGNYAVIEYTDNGIGISEKNRKLVGVYGFSERGSGKGIYNIIKTLKGWGGNFKIIESNKGYRAHLQLPCKQ